METTCQRCHETLRDADRYCPVCGLPQLMYVAAELPVRALGSEEDDETSAAGGVPLDGQLGLAGSLGVEIQSGVGGIVWKPALRAALILGIPAGVLCSEITPIGPVLGLFWMVSAAAWAVSLYVKRTQIGRLSMASGARIGLVVGLLASWFTLILNGAYLWVERFLLHQGTQMDAQWLAQVEASMQMNQQMVTEMGMATAQSAQFQQTWRALMMSAEGRAGLELWGLLAGAAFLTFFAMLGGAMGARFLTQRGRTRA